jgi:subtilisin family serine protease
VFNIGYEVVMKYNGEILKLEKSKDEKVEIEFIVGEDEKLLNMNIYTDFVDDFSVYLVSPSNTQTKPISLTSTKIKNIIGKTKIKGYFYPIAPYTLANRISIQMSSKTSISHGIWKLVFEQMSRVTGNIDIYLQTTEEDLKNITLSKKDKKSTVIFPKNESKAVKEKHDYKDNKLSKRQVDNSMENLIPAFNIIHEPEFEEEFEKLKTSYKYYKIADNFGIIFIDPQIINQATLQRVRAILSLKSVLSSEPWARMALLGEISQGTSQGVVATEDIGANFFKNNPNISVTGKGVIIGIIDSGIDYLHEDFIYPDRTSKILYLWDQTKDGNPPTGYAIGTEYTREDINNAIQNNDPSLSIDEEGQGTMISGICAGLGNINKEYAGVAEDAQLIVIKMKKINDFYNNAMLVVSTQYLLEKARILNMPIVINTSVGSNRLVGINSRTIQETSFFTRGTVIVSAAGNEGNAQTHASGKIEFAGNIKEIDIELLEDEDELEIQILTNKPDKMSIIIVTPTGETSKILQVANFAYISGVFDLEGTDYLIRYIYPTISSGQQETLVNLNNPKKGVWKIRIIGEYITSGIYHVYLPNRVFLNPGTKFSNPDPLYTINYPGIFDAIITVGAYDTKNESLWSSSSRGPTIDNLLKPEIVAPGVDIIAPYPGNKYATITGTAAAAAYTSGSVSLFLQYALVDNNYPNRSFVQQIRTYIEAGTKRQSNITYPNTAYGYGILDIRGMFDQLR